jgi:EAL domain-containing protein (putative c-di-GMP-specific phosphodiesterase class I)/GGDEF domain-containing protein
METKRPEGTDDRYRIEYLKLRSALHDRTTGLSAYPVLVDELRALLDARRHLGVIHVEPANIDLVESLYGWQVFDRVMARLGAVLKELPGSDLPAGALLAAGGVPADRFVVFVPEGPRGTDVDPEDLAAMSAAVKARLESVLDEDEATAALSPRPTVRTGYALLSENPFYRFERRIHAAVEEARRLSDRRAARRDRVWGRELKRAIREARIRTVWQPVVELASGSVFGFEALSRGPANSMFEMPRAMFALSGRVGASEDLDRHCRAAALRDGAAVAGSRKLFVNVLPAGLADPAWRNGGVPGLLRDGGRRASDVVVEVSERTVGSCTDAIAAAAAGLRAEGFAIALDDAGSGRDGPAVIDRLRPDFVKIEPTLVRGVDANLLKQEIVAALVRLGEGIGAAVVAVGVESAEEAATLHTLGARYGQGYHFAGPAPREQWAP